MPLHVLSAEKQFCRWGDCKNGIGEKVYPQDSGTNFSYIAKFKDGRRQDYGIRINEGNPWICEVSVFDGRTVGLRFCATEEGSISYRYYDVGVQKGSDHYRVSDKGKVTVGRWFADDNLWIVPVDLDQIHEDHRSLRKKGTRLKQYLPSWFPDPPGRVRLKTDKPFLSEKKMLTAVKENKAAEARTQNKKSSETVKADVKKEEVTTGCYFGDCKNGFGSYRWKSGTRHTGYWQNSQQHGYGAYVTSAGKECDSNFDQGKRKGLSVCLQGSTANANYYIAGKKTGRGIEWDSKTGEIQKLGSWRSGDFIREHSINLKLLSADWAVLRGSLSNGMRSLTFGEEFRALVLPEDRQSEWLRARELARASKTQVIPQEAPMKLGCISGNCEDGFGEFATPDMTFTGTFKNRRVSGYTLITSSEQQCEARMRGGFHAGLEHCVGIQSGNHSFAYRTKAGLQRAKITISPNGDLVSYRVYENDEEISISFSSEAEKQELAAVEFENFYGDLIKFKRKAPREARVLRVASLEKIPPIRFGSDVDDAYEEPIEKPKTVSKPKPSPKTKSPETTKSKAKVVAKSSSIVPLKPPQAVSKSEANKPQSDLQRLAYIAAELNAGSRQINFNYRLDKVRIDPNKFELVYEFTAMVPIRDLDTSVISVANKTAYCSTSKLKPFRDENMPARWSYVDADEQTFEVLTGVSDCI
ncbi:hypothetical protein N9D87_00795 [bacterium]|nr:hypothetical protein [bacterium]